MKKIDTYSRLKDVDSRTRAGGWASASRRLKLVAVGVLVLLALAGIWMGGADWLTGERALSPADSQARYGSVDSEKDQSVFEAVTFVPSGMRKPTEREKEIAALRYKRDGIGRELRRLAAQYEHAIESAVANDPELKVIHEERKILDTQLDEELLDPKMYDLAQWSFEEKKKFVEELRKAGHDPSDLGPIKEYVEGEIKKLRQFYFLHEMDRQLSNPEQADLAGAWLRERLEPSDLEAEFYSESFGRPGRFTSFREFSDEVVPEVSLLRELLNQTGRSERIATHVGDNEIDMIDSSMPDGVEEQIGRLTRMGMRRGMLERRLHEEIPELKALAKRRKELLIAHPKAHFEVRQLAQQNFTVDEITNNR